MYARDLQKAADVSASEVRTLRKTIRHRQIFLAVMALLITPLLFGPSLAVTHSYVTLQSTGTILRANVNLAVIPDDWSLTYGSDPQIVFLDTNMEHTAGKPSIRLEAYTGAGGNTEREVDGTWYTIKPGDHLIAKCWIKTSASGMGSSDYRLGGRIGIDFYAHTSVGYGIVGSADTCIGDSPDDHSGIAGQDCIQNWGKDWAQKGWDLIVPTKFFTQVRRGNWYTCDPVQIDSFVAWLDGRPIPDTGRIWFADAAIYINPQ